MENPRTWNDIQKTINTAITDHRKRCDEHYCGPSQATAIYTELLAKGYIKPDPKHCGGDGCPGCYHCNSKNFPTASADKTQSGDKK